MSVCPPFLSFAIRRSSIQLLTMGLAGSLLSGCALVRPLTDLLPDVLPAPAPTPTTLAVAGLPAGVPAQVSLLTPPGAATPAPSSGQAPAFDTVVRGAERSDGLLPIWRRQDKVWIELAPADFGRAFFLSPKMRTGLGEAGFFGGLLANRNAQVGRPQWVEFRRVNQQVQLVAINASFTATPGTPQALAVQDAFSHSLLASVPIASQPQGSEGKVLVELSSLMSGDLLGLGLQLQRTFRQGYALDARNSGVTQARTTTSGLLLEVQQHYATGSLTSSAPSSGAQPAIPTVLPDPRSLFLTVQYTLSPLPAQAMAPRLADARIGHFISTVADFTNDLARTPRVRYVNRWRLEKKDPQAAISEPVRPLVFWLDRNIPDDYRPTIRDAVLAWNAAFEAIGFKNAIQVRDSTADQPLDIVGNGQAIIRWMTNARPTFGAIGPSHVDPRTGEILTAEVALESLSARAIRAVRSQVFSGEDSAQSRAHHSKPGSADAADPSTLPFEDRCDHAEIAAEQMSYGLDVWALAHDVPGDLPPDSAEVRSFVLAYLRDTTMHEVGHALGLRHNFKASRWHTQAQLLDAKLTAREGNSASVMDYAAINLSAPGQPPVTPFQTTLGPYDYWAIEYAYKPLPGGAAEQKDALDAIARRSADPKLALALAYGTDEDNALGLDPEALTFDLGRDPIAFARTRMSIARDLIARQTTAPLRPTDDAAVLRRRVGYALRDIERTAEILTRQIGGVVTRRGTAASGLDALDPLPAETQRAALNLLLDQILSPHGLQLPPALQRRLAPDYLERGESLFLGGGVSPTDFSAAVQLGVLQRSVLSDLMADGLADRLLDNIDKTRDREPRPLTLGELHQRLRATIWASPDSPQERLVPPPWRRNLQRDHVNRLSAALLRGANRADVRVQLRLQAEQLAKLLSRPGVLGSKDPASVAEAHRRDCLDTLQRALDATVVRNNP